MPGSLAVGRTHLTTECVLRLDGLLILLAIGVVLCHQHEADAEGSYGVEAHVRRNVEDGFDVEQLGVPLETFEALAGLSQDFVEGGVQLLQHRTDLGVVVDELVRHEHEVVIVQAVLERSICFGRDCDTVLGGDQRDRLVQSVANLVDRPPCECVGVHDHHDAALGSVVGGAFLGVLTGVGVGQLAAQCLEQSGSFRSVRDNVVIACFLQDDNNIYRGEECLGTGHSKELVL